MKKRLIQLIAKKSGRVFKRFGFAKKTLAKNSVVQSSQVLTGGGGAGIAIAEGQALKMGQSGLMKVGRSEAAVYNRVFKGRKGLLSARRAKFGNVSEAIVVREATSSSKFWSKVQPLASKAGGFVLGAAGWYGVDALLSYAFDKATSEEEGPSQVAAETEARNAIAEMTKVNALEDALTSGSRSGRRRDDADGSNYYQGVELSDQADLVKRLMFDLGLSATGDITSGLDVSNLSTYGHYERADLILRLVTIIKAIANISSSPEVYTLLARQGMSSSLDAVGWTESFERLVKLDEVETTSLEAIASEFNALYEGLFEEHRIDVADTYFNEATSLFNFKSDRSVDFDENESSNDAIVAKRRFALASMVTDDSFADVEGWWDRLKVDADNPKDDEFLAAQEMIRYSTLGSDFIAAYTAAVNEDSYRRRSILARG